MKVQVYLNSHINKISIRVKGKGVVAHACQVILSDAEFKVSERGRQRTIQKKQKNVHAIIEGDLIFADDLTYMENKNTRFKFIRRQKMLDNDIKVVYNPYKYSKFTVEESNLSVTRAEQVSVISNGLVMAKGVQCEAG